MSGLHPVLLVSLSLSPGASPLLFPYFSCLFLTSGWSVSPFTLSPFSVNTLSEALQSGKSLRMDPKGFHSPGKHRGIFSPSCSFFQMPCAVHVYIPEGKGAMIRLGGGWQENQVAEVNDHCVCWTGLGRIGTSTDRDQTKGSTISGWSIKSVKRLQSYFFVLMLCENLRILSYICLM